MYRRWILVLITAALATACSQPEAKSEPRENLKHDVESADHAIAMVDDEEPERSQIARAAFQISDDELQARRSLPDIIEEVMPSVVGITTERTIRQRAPSSFFDDPFFRGFGGPSHRQPQERVQQGIGSGVIVDESGIIITNNHVIDGADVIRIGLSDGRELNAEVEGTDPESDLAVLRIIEAPDDLRALAFGDSDALRLGESVIAIGNPFGLSGTVTMGIISAKGRAGVGILDYENFIQTDAAINPGNSGGALIDLKGELIGINTAIMTRSGGYQGVGFAIPSNMAEMVMRGLLDDGQVQRGWLGVVIQQLTPELAEALNLEEGIEGVVISDVQPGSPAEEAGLKRGDVVTHIDDRRVRTPGELRNTIGLRAPHTTVAVRAVSNGTTRELTIELGSLHDGRALQEGRLAPGLPEVTSVIEGLQLQPLDRELRQQLRVPDALQHGLVVTGVQPGSEAAMRGLREGDIFIEVNRRVVRTVEEFNAAYDVDRRRNLVLLYRDGSTIYMTW